MLPVTPERLAGVYEMLRGWPPFSGWNLPPAESVKFHVLKTDQWHADWWIDEAERHHIRVSEKKHGHLASLVESMAHEMIHAHCDRRGVRGEHGRDFQAAADKVCRFHGFDRKSF